MTERTVCAAGILIAVTVAGFAVWRLAATSLTRSGVITCWTVLALCTVLAAADGITLARHRDEP